MRRFGGGRSSGGLSFALGGLAAVAEAKLFRQRRAAFGVRRCGEWVGVLQIPAGAVVARRKTVRRGEVAAEHFAAPSAFKTGDEIAAVGSVYGDSGLRRRNFSGRAEPSKGPVDGGDKVWEFACRDRVVGDVAADDFGNERRVDLFWFSLLFSPPLDQTQYTARSAGEFTSFY